MKKRLALLIFIALLLTLCGCAETETPVMMDATVNIKTTEAARGSLQSECSYIAAISAEGTARVIPMVSANVESIEVQVGDRVTAGQALCSLDDTSAQLTLETAKASISRLRRGFFPPRRGPSRPAPLSTLPSRAITPPSPNMAGRGESRCRYWRSRCVWRRKTMQTPWPC